MSEGDTGVADAFVSRARAQRRGRHWYVRVGELAAGLSANWAICYGFDYLLYPFVIYQLGLLRGGAVMSLLSLLACLLTLWFYDWSKRDWLGIEAIKSLKDYSGPNPWRRAIGRGLRWGDIPGCILLSFYYDPFITMVYLRKGSYGEVTRRDWGVFLLSWAIGNCFWISACFGGISFVEWVWTHLSPH